VSSAGGQVTLSAQVANAASCVFSSTTKTLAGLPATVNCTSGSGSAQVTLPANSTGQAKTYSFGLSAVGSKTVKATAVKVTVSPATGPVPVQHESGTLTQSATWSPKLASAYLVDGSLDIPAGITLTIAAGTVIKVASQLTVEGTLDAVGTSSSPVVFTSVNDDSVGGDTGEQGTAPAAGDWYGISLSAGSGGSSPQVSLTDTDIDYAASALSGSGSGAGSSLSVSGGQFAHIDSSAIDVSSVSLSVTGSTFTDVAGDGIDVSGPAGIPVVTGNTVAAQGHAMTIRNASLDLAKLDNNTVSGGGNDGVWLGGDTVSVSSALPWSGGMVPVLDESDCQAPLDVPSGVTMTLNAGTVVKAYQGCSYYRAAALPMTVEGTLDAVGTSSSPVVFTSVNDDSVGGDTGEQGTAPAAGDWYGISVSGAGTLSLKQTSIFYAAAAIQFAGASGLLSSTTIEHSDVAIVDSSGGLTVRGTLEDNAQGILACSWADSCSVDAAYVDWGPAGPFPAGGSALVCGAVTVTPWVGAAPGVNSNFWASANCDGSDSPATQLADAESGYNQTIADQQIDCSDGFQQVCDEIKTEQSCYSAAEKLAWNNVTIAGIPATPPDNSSVGDVVDSWMSSAENEVVSTLGDVLGFAKDMKGVLTLYQQLDSAYSSCS
jgi:hypothetical protein